MTSNFSPESKFVWIHWNTPRVSWGIVAMPTSIVLQLLRPITWTCSKNKQNDLDGCAAGLGMRTKIECGWGGSSLVCSHADLPLDSTNQLSQQIKSFTYIIKQDTICKQSALAEAPSSGFIPTWIIIVFALLSLVLWFLRMVNRVYILAQICALHANPSTRAHGCPQPFYRSRTPALTAAVDLEAW